jgi:hypothetical protein
VYNKHRMEISKSTNKNKRLKATFSDGSVIHFGYKGGSTYVDHGDSNKRENYLKRHSENPKESKYFNNPEKNYKTPSVLSKEILWGKSKDINDNVKSFKKRYL